MPAASLPGTAVALLVAVASGLLLVLAFPPVGWWPLAPVALAGFRLSMHEARPARAAMLGLAFGLAFFLPLLHWTGIFVGALPWLVLASVEAVYLAGFGAVAALGARAPVAWLSFPGLWVLQEAVRSRVPFGGFPWGRLAFSQADAPTLGLAAIGGAPLVSFAVALAGSCLAAASLRLWRLSSPVRRRPADSPRLLRSGVAAMAVLAFAVMAAGLLVPDPQPPTTTATVALVQGNVPRLGLDFNAQREAVLSNHVDATLALADDVQAGRAPAPDLVVWPENSSDVDPLRNPEAAAAIQQATDAIGVPVLVGAVLQGPGNKLSNAGIVWSPGSGPGEQYIKRHPVPFAEYIPFRSFARLFSAEVDRVAHDFAPGTDASPLPMGPASVGDVICFEVAYDGLVRDVVRQGADLLVVQTNNATFGRSPESVQQLAMSRLRAVEHGRSVLAVSTSGVSAVIDDRGQVRQQSEIFTRAVFVERVGLRSPLTVASRIGAWPELALCLLGALGALLGGIVTSRWRLRRRTT